MVSTCTRGRDPSRDGHRSRVGRGCFVPRLCLYRRGTPLGPMSLDARGYINRYASITSCSRCSGRSRSRRRGSFTDRLYASARRRTPARSSACSGTTRSRAVPSAERVSPRPSSMRSRQYFGFCTLFLLDRAAPCPLRLSDPRGPPHNYPPLLLLSSTAVSDSAAPGACT